MFGVTFTDAPVAKKDKKEKKKKHKKEKKKSKSSKEHKHGSAKDPSSSSSGPDASDGGASDKETEAPAPAVQREAWMTQPMARLHAPAPEKEPEKEAAPAEPEIVIGLRVMKPGGGTPNPGGPAAAPARPVVGDGGLSWRLKALKRAQEAAAAAGQDVGAVVSERWGSLQNLAGSLTEGRAADSRAHLHAARDRERGGGGGGGGGDRAASKSHYLSDLKSEKGQMKRPVMDDSLRWRKPGGRGDEGGAGRPARDRDGRDDDGDRGASRGADRADRDRRDGRDGGGRGGERDRDNEARRYRQEADDDRDGHDRGEGDRRHHHHHHHHHRDGGGDRDRHRRDDDDDGHKGGRRHESRDGARDRRGAAMNSEQASALQGLAASLNRVADDGSFLERFQARQQRVEGRDDGSGGGPADRAGNGGGGGGGGGSRAADARAAERDRRQAAAEAMRDEMRQLRAGMSMEGGSEGEGEDWEHGQKRAAPEPGAELDIDSEQDDDGPAAGGGGGPYRQPQRQQQQGSHQARQQPAAPAPPPGGGSNQSVADMLRARLKGLPVPTPSAAPATAGGDAGPSGGGGGGGSREVVALPLVDASGRAVKGAFGRESAGQGGPVDDGRPKRKIQRYDAAGEKVRYFADDESADLDTLVKRARHGDDTNEQLDKTVAMNIMRKSRFRTKELDVDDEYEHDGGLDYYESKSRKGTADQQAAREKSRQVAAFNKMKRAEQQCMLCVSNTSRPVHLTIAAGTCAYLMLPARGRLVPGHCCIVPNEHVPSMRMVDDNVWTEVKNFIKCLIQMYAAQERHVIFWETATQLGGNRRHAMLEAVPVGQRELDKAPGYFKKAMQEAESEWSTHHAKAAIETNAKKGLRESIPPNFPYLYVQFGYNKGYVHVIDDESKFDAELGRQVMVGLLRLPPEVMHQRHKMESTATQHQWAREFITGWAPYDWTLQLH